MRIEKIVGTIAQIELKDRELDYVLLDHLDLNKPHQRVNSQGGRELAVSLPHGEQLYKGAVLYEDDSLVVAVELLEEDVYEIKPEGIVQWARVSFNIGNMHQPAYITQQDICIPYDPVMERIFAALDVKFTRTRRQLDGVRANISAGAGHSHSHSQDDHGHHHHE